MNNRKILLVLAIFCFVLCAIVFLTGVARAGSVTFSWLPNSEEHLTGYEVRCSAQSVEDLAGDPHELWNAVGKEATDGRVEYTWDDFPERVKYYCVCVAKGISGGKIVTSDFSEEVDFTYSSETEGMAAPSGMTVTVNVYVD